MGFSWSIPEQQFFFFFPKSHLQRTALNLQAPSSRGCCRPALSTFPSDRDPSMIPNELGLGPGRDNSLSNPRRGEAASAVTTPLPLAPCAEQSLGTRQVWNCLQPLQESLKKMLKVQKKNPKQPSAGASIPAWCLSLK